MTSYEELVAEAATVDVSGWDFSWLDGRASEERPSWGYQRLLRRRFASARSALDLQTGGAEVVAGAGPLPARFVATESWAPNLAVARRALGPLGGQVVLAPDEGPLPLADASFDLVTTRHPVVTPWAEAARVLAPGGTFFSQQVGPDSARELSEWFLGPWPPGPQARDPEVARARATGAGLDVLDLRLERLRMELLDIGAVVYILRKCPWWVPEFSVERYGDRLRALHDLIEVDGAFVAHSTRFLIEARRR
ncbi:methyltransferase domain-containing protein [Luteipulveratus flavus]|uniref:Methyltransferase domain-containing protein n=1 Tax=Luteipulveratus flavus TaxID=3031728 RepID=A0ABT6C3W5_9MICO|nr:methyltransferase domain-containing protein [Luteipulveratus sp. YIM 133296]MDF8263248.1 methyltransferase domain-containing protein [Luteipulveratus sp. YIM 133296]